MKMNVGHFGPVLCIKGLKSQIWSNLNELLLTSCGSYECFEEGQRFGKGIKEESLHTLNRPAAATSCCERAHDLEGHSSSEGFLNSTHLYTSTTSHVSHVGRWSFGVEQYFDWVSYFAAFGPLCTIHRSVLITTFNLKLFAFPFMLAQFPDIL